VCRGPLNLSPWLYVIPLELAPFKDLLAALAVPPSFTPSQYCQVCHPPLALLAEAWLVSCPSWPL
jgi:hypothetical protein